MSSPGMHHHARRLVQHRNNVILEEDLERHLLGRADSQGVSAGSRQTISSSGRTICEAFARAPLRSTPPERITAWILERETAGKHSASQRSSQLPALAEETLKTRCPDAEAGEFLCEKIISAG